MNFNPRTHVGCDGGDVRPCRLQAVISIHAPTWGATYGQHVCNSTAIFQSTHPRGVRQINDETISETSDISIHAPTWGATRSHNGSFLRYSNFNPRTHVGCDRAENTISTLTGIFQSTHPRGVRRSTNNGLSVRTNFNPRTHVGCDVVAAGIGSVPREFQSTHPRGVRQSRKHH